MMIYLKLIVACVVAVMSFAGAGLLRSKKYSLPRIAKRMYEGMKRSENFRKFFTLILLMVMLAMQFIDFHASTEIARMLQDSNASHNDTMLTMATYAPLMTRPYATLIAAALSLSFFSYKLADKVLTKLHNNRRLFALIGLAVVLLTVFLPRWIVVSEMLAITLMAGYVYPNKIMYE